MNRPFALLLTTFSLLPLNAPAAQVAHARAYCLSLQFNQGSEPFGLYSLDLTTLDPAVNGELGAFFFQSAYTHGCWINLNDEFLGDAPIPGAMVLDAPPFIDVDGDGFDDFFDVSHSVTPSGQNTSSGEFDFGAEFGTVEATWSRAAGSSSGTCVLVFRTNPFQSAYEFTHTFHLIEYTGEISYTPGTANVSGLLDLTGSANLEARLSGNLDFVKSVADPVGELQIQADILTNELGQEFQILGDTLFRDATWPTNYYGLLEFQDGQPATFEDDYYYWQISIDDLNDADADGIPDFSDDPQGPQPAAPRLAVNIGTTNILLTINGDTGRVHEILTAGSIDSATWQTNLTFTLTNNPRVISLSKPAATTFWRVRAL